MAQYSDIVGAIVAERRRRGWSQADLADRLGVVQSAVGNWEAGRNKIPLPQLVSIGAVFGWELEWLPSDPSKADVMRQLRSFADALGEARLHQLVALAEALPRIDSGLVDGLLIMADQSRTHQAKPA